MPSKSGWLCPYCNHYATLTSENIDTEVHRFNCGNKYNGSLALVTRVTVCPNPECREIQLSVSLFGDGSQSKVLGCSSKLERTWNLLPEFLAKPLPDYIPEAIRGDYLEACLILDKSPKASATLARRCLQGMIRDFWGISKPKLVQEINALKEEIDTETWEAINAVREIGNIGAHMERDVNVIVDVEPEEAGALIQLIEYLIEDWYVARHQKAQNRQGIVQMAKEKKAIKEQAKALAQA